MTDREVWLEIARRLEYTPRTYGPGSKRAQGLCLYVSDLGGAGLISYDDETRLTRRIHAVFGKFAAQEYFWPEYDRKHRILAAGLLAAMATRNLK